MITQALGISVGDIISTSYGSGPYRVVEISQPVKFSIRALHIVIRDHEVTHLKLADLDGESKTPSYIGSIRRVGSDRWATDMNDEIFVEKKGEVSGAQLDLFSVLTPEAAPDYDFQAGCDYRAGAGKVWRCDGCGKDFNTAESSKRSASCPDCASGSTAIYFMAAPALDDWRPYPSEFNITLDCRDYLPCENNVTKTYRKRQAQSV
jgi:hypothetical protein